MSPLLLRRYRAERLLRDDFEAQRAQVLASVRRRLQGCSVELDRADLEACYATAWQGLYGAVLEGQEIASPVGWLILVTFRRAIEEHRSSSRARRSLPAGDLGLGVESDLAAQLDDRRALRQLLAGMRARLDAREREAATLCYLHGLSRAEAAARMGVTEAGMRKLMDGRGPGRPGVAGKVGRLVRAIAQGSFCDEHASLMRAFAFGVLDPAGARYELAAAHRRECPACRSYVASLRGLAAVLPPVLSPWGVGGRLLTGAGAGGWGSLSGASGLGAGGAAAGGSWALAGPFAGKFAAGCLLALGVGGGCVIVASQGGGGPHASGGAHARGVGGVTPRPERPAAYAARAPVVARSAGQRTQATRPQRSSAALEFGFEREPGSSAVRPAAHATAASSSGRASSPAGRGASAPAPGGAGTAAREFGPG